MDKSLKNSREHRCVKSSFLLKKIRTHGYVVPLDFREISLSVRRGANVKEKRVRTVSRSTVKRARYNRGPRWEERNRSRHKQVLIVPRAFAALNKY